STTAAHVCPLLNSGPNFIGSFNNTTNSTGYSHPPSPSAAVYSGTTLIPGAVDGTSTIGFQHAVDFTVDSLGWRVNTNVSFPVIVAQMVPFTLLADYHLTDLSSTQYALNVGAAPTANCATSVVPCKDIDNDSRFSGSTDRGADEISVSADISISKTDSRTSVVAGGQTTYTIVVTNNGPSAASGATVADTLPASLTGATWTCTGSCAPGAASGSGNINQTIDLAKFASATYSVTATVAANATGSIANTATVSVLPIDPDATNNSSTDTDVVAPPAPTPGPLDNFNRADNICLNNGANWSQTCAPFVGAAIRVNGNTAYAPLLAGTAMWNNPAAGFGVKQAAGFTIGSTNVNGMALILKASGGSAANPNSYVRVRLTSTGVVLETTASAAALATITTPLAVGDTVLAQVNATGRIDVWRNGSWLGTAQAPAAFNGGGRIGIQMPGALPIIGTPARLDNFLGGSVA
ncbi:MAG: DUF11 domain-containing protein, partial [Ilumatobacteraceae bacterium]